MAIAIAALSQGNILDGFAGPFRYDANNVEFNFAVLIYDAATQEKRLLEVRAIIPDGSSLAAIRTIATTAVVNAATSSGMTVPRASVLLPVFQFGQ
jgi:hypothetical protein